MPKLKTKANMPIPKHKWRPENEKHPVMFKKYLVNLLSLNNKTFYVLATEQGFHTVTSEWEVGRMLALSLFSFFFCNGRSDG